MGRLNDLTHPSVPSQEGRFGLKWPLPIERGIGLSEPFTDLIKRVFSLLKLYGQAE